MLPGGTYGGRSGATVSSGSRGMASFLGGSIGTVTSALGTLWRNRQERREARRSREWSEYMSNTAVQRRMEDMRKAGIHPILAAKYDASTPASAMASMENIGKEAVQGGVAGVTSALAIKRQAQELQNMEAQEELTRASASQTRANEQLIRIQQRLAKYNADIREPAAFWLQALMGVIPDNVRQDPRRFRSWFMGEFNKFISEHADSIKHVTQLGKDLFSIFQTENDKPGGSIPTEKQLYLEWMEYYNRQDMSDKAADRLAKSAARNGRRPPNRRN